MSRAQDLRHCWYSPSPDNWAARAADQYRFPRGVRSVTHTALLGDPAIAVLIRTYLPPNAVYLGVGEYVSRGALGEYVSRTDIRSSRRAKKLVAPRGAKNDQSRVSDRVRPRRQ